MKLIDFEVVQETSNHVFFDIQYTYWWSSEIKTAKFIKNKKSGDYYNRESFKRPFKAQEIVFEGLLEWHSEVLVNSKYIFNGVIDELKAKA